MTSQSTSVLLVEDETDLAALYAEWLKKEQFDVHVANSGSEAFSELNDGIDVVLLDRRMPTVSGDVVLEKIKDQGYSCRVAMVTAVEPDFDIIDLGFDDYLVKPVGKSELIGTVDRLKSRMAYDTEFDRYVSLISKKAMLESEKSVKELNTNPEFQELETEVAELREDIDTMVGKFDAEDVAAVLRDQNQVLDPAWSN